jgi:hypothetical protein
MKNPAPPKIDPYFTFLQGNAFFQANRLVQTGAAATPYDLRIPGCTLSAFACELFFKCLICIETDTAPKGHNLKRLFDTLQRSTKRELEALWADYASAAKATWDDYERQHNIVIPRDLSGALSAGSRAFEGLRYMHEPNSLVFVYCLDDFPWALGHVISSRKPEWFTADWTNRYRTPPTFQIR